MGDLENDELLPDGWRVEVRVRKNGKKDKYYTDPVSGYRFRSMKDAVRYLETGEIGRLAYKPKDKDSHDEEDFEDEKCSVSLLMIELSESISLCHQSPTTAKKQKLAVPGTEADITGQSTKLSEVVKNEGALHSVSTGECISCPEHTSGLGGAGTEVSNLSEANDSDKMGWGKDSDKNVLLSTPKVGVLPDKLSETEEIRDESRKTTPGKCRSRKKKVLYLPRRASKRLAGLALDPTPELKTSNRTRRAVVKKSDVIVASTDKGSCSDRRGYKGLQQPEVEPKPEANCAIETSKSTEVLTESRASKHPSGDPNGRAEKIEMEYKTDKKQECAVVSPLKNQDRIETSKADEKSGPAIDLPFDDLLSDPCIAFAIKTLTGVTFETSSCNKEVSLESNNSKSAGLANLEEAAGKQTDNESDKKLNLATPEERASNVESNYKTNELGNPLDLPFADMWTDPCIEFAIKTLTGTIPVGYDLDMQDYIQQQLDSSQTQARNNFCQTELCQQYDALEKPVSREQAWTGNLNIQNSGGASFHQQSDKRYSEWR